MNFANYFWTPENLDPYSQITDRISSVIESVNSFFRFFDAIYYLCEFGISLVIFRET